VLTSQLPADGRAPATVFCRDGVTHSFDTSDALTCCKVLVQAVLHAGVHTPPLLPLLLMARRCRFDAPMPNDVATSCTCDKGC